MKKIFFTSIVFSLLFLTSCGLFDHTCCDGGCKNEVVVNNNLCCGTSATMMEEKIITKIKIDTIYEKVMVPIDPCKGCDKADKKADLPH
jgi:hypothetical protein